jgi:capsular exopolysaccharide synthesis family protein
MPDKDLGKAVTETILLQNLEADQEGDAISGPITTIEPAEVNERLVVFHRPRSIESEYFRFIKHRIEQQMEAKETNKGKVIMVTGPNLDVGKTTCSINLALVFARSYGGKTLLMDADTRRATSRKYLGIKEDSLPGLVDVLTMRERAGKVLLNTGLFDMVYFPSGQFSDAFIDDLKGKELSHLLNSLRERFSYIIIDSPPAFPMPEPAIIAQHCDGVFIVLRAGRDGKQDLEQAREALEGANLMGVILNAVKTTPGQKYGSYGYYGKR